MPVKHMKLESVRGKFPVHARRDGKEAEEGWDGDGSAAHSAVHSAVAAKSAQATGGASHQQEEQNADDNGMASHEGFQHGSIRTKWRHLKKRSEY